MYEGASVLIHVGLWTGCVGTIHSPAGPDSVNVTCPDGQLAVYYPQHELELVRSIPDNA